MAKQACLHRGAYLFWSHNKEHLLCSVGTVVCLSHGQTEENKDKKKLLSKFISNVYLLA